MIHLVIAGRNNSDHLDECFQSILKQESPPPYRVTCIDDASTDDSYQKSLKYSSPNIRIINSTERKGGLCHYYTWGCASEDGEVVVFMGRDDVLKPNALSLIAQQYQHPDTWLTYGSVANDDKTRGPSGRMFHYDYRHHPYGWMPISCRAALLKKVRPEDLQIQGYWFPTAGDSALIFPLLDMCGTDGEMIGRIRYISEKWYLRRIHPSNDHILEGKHQSYYGWAARCKEQYSRLSSLEDTPTQTPHDLRFAIVLVPQASQGAYMPIAIDHENDQYQLLPNFDWKTVYNPGLMMNPYRLNVHEDPFEIFFSKYSGTPQLMIGGKSFPEPPIYTRGNAYVGSPDVPDDEIWLKVDEGKYEKFKREAFERQDVLFDPVTGERLQ